MEAVVAGHRLVAGVGQAIDGQSGEAEGTVLHFVDGHMLRPSAGYLLSALLGDRALGADAAPNSTHFLNF